MKRISLLIVLVFLVACGAAEVETKQDDEVGQEDEPKEERIEIEMVSDEEYELVLIDNNDLMIMLMGVKHERHNDYDLIDHLFMDIKIHNKQNRTFDFYFKDIALDGDQNKFNIGMDETEIGPNEKTIIKVNMFVDILENDKTFTFNEHISGNLVYSDYDGNRKDIGFSEYINE